MLPRYSRLCRVSDGSDGAEDQAISALALPLDRYLQFQLPSSERLAGFAVCLDVVAKGSGDTVAAEYFADGWVRVESGCEWCATSGAVSLDARDWCGPARSTGLRIPGARSHLSWSRSGAKRLAGRVPIPIACARSSAAPPAMPWPRKVFSRRREDRFLSRESQLSWQGHYLDSASWNAEVQFCRKLILREAWLRNVTLSGLCNSTRQCVAACRDCDVCVDVI